MSAALYPNNSVICESLIGTYIKSRYYDKAKGLIASANAATPKGIYNILLGDIALDQGDTDKAKYIWQNTANDHPEDDQVLFEIAKRYNKIGEYEAAISTYEKSYDTTPAPKVLDVLP
ncbi:MAG: hypothetical protein II711_04035 [Clostridia bacterium]|nr:hypothetical protein [Clostridia bacterium]